MTTLTIYPDYDADSIVLHTHDHHQVCRELEQIGIPFSRWNAHATLALDASAETVMTAYEGEIASLNAKYGFKSMDVITMHPEHPQAETARSKFLAEHVHADFEIRFFVDGAGAFYIHKLDRVYRVVCTAGDLIELPANTTHWFDMGAQPFFKAIRFFTEPDGWVASFTGSPIAAKFPPFESPRP